MQVGSCHRWGLFSNRYPGGLAWILHLLSFSFETSFRCDIYGTNSVAKLAAYCLPTFPILLHIGVLGPYPQKQVVTRELETLIANNQ